MVEKLWHVCQAAVAAAGAFLGWFIGGIDGAVFALIVCMVADYVTGVMHAIVNKNLSSEIGAKGIFKKMTIFMLVGVAHLIDVQVIGDGNVLRTAVVFFYISNEGISLLENASALGLPIPEKLKMILAQLHKKTKPNDPNENSDNQPK